MWYVNDYALMESNILSPIFTGYANIDIFFAAVRMVYYPYFSWNGIVYKVNDGQIGYTSTGLTIGEVISLNYEQ